MPRIARRRPQSQAVNMRSSMHLAVKDSVASAALPEEKEPEGEEKPLCHIFLVEVDGKLERVEVELEGEELQIVRRRLNQQREDETKLRQRRRERVEKLEEMEEALQEVAYRHSLVLSPPEQALDSGKTLPPTRDTYEQN